MDNSPFNNLAAELRNRIYEYALTAEGDIEVDAYETMDSVRRDSHFDAEDISRRLALTATCKQIRQEALPIFYSGNCFNFETRVLSDWDEDLMCKENDLVVAVLKRWCSALATSSSYLRHVRIDFRLWHTYDPNDDYLVPRMPEWLREYNTIFAESKTRLEIRFCVRWCSVDEEYHQQMPQLAFAVNPWNLAKFHDDIETAMSDERDVVRSFLRSRKTFGGFETVEDLRSEVQWDFRHAGTLLRQFLKVLRDTNMEV